MRALTISTTFVALASTCVSSFAGEKDIGQCMRVDCASMQQYCEESHKAGKTGTNCAVAGKACLQSAGPRWHGVTADGKKWTCKF
jgi:hypothetical protein